MITWSHATDKMAFTYLENGEYTVWTIDNPRLLKRQPFNAAAVPTVAQREDSAAARRAARVDSTTADSLSYSYYRSGTTFRSSSALSDSGPHTETRINVASILDSGACSCPTRISSSSTSTDIRFSPDFVARPTVGYSRDNFGNGVFGGTADLAQRHGGQQSPRLRAFDQRAPRGRAGARGVHESLASPPVRGGVPAVPVLLR